MKQSTIFFDKFEDKEIKMQKMQESLVQVSNNFKTLNQFMMILENKEDKNILSKFWVINKISSSGG